MLRGTRLLLVALACALALPAVASAKVWVVKGAGFGHGVGMSQYGAYGYAKHGFTYDAILTHYYTGTTIGSTADQSVRVLLRDSVGSVAFHGASSACGTAIKPGTTYVAKRKGSGVMVRSKKGTVIARCGAAMTATGAPAIAVTGKGTYRGSLPPCPSASCHGAPLAVGDAHLFERLGAHSLPRSAQNPSRDARRAVPLDSGSLA